MRNFVGNILHVKAVNMYFTKKALYRIYINPLFGKYNIYLGIKRQ